MHKKSVLIFGFLLSSLVMLSAIPLLNNNNTVATAQEYGGDSSYSQYPTDDNKYQCRTGPFEGFFVSSVEFCKHIKFDDKDRKDHSRDNITGTQGPPGPQGPAGPQGPPGATGATGPQGERGLTGATGPAGAASPVPGPQGERGFNGTNGINGTQGPSGITFINGTNTYRLQSVSTNFTCGGGGFFCTQVTLFCSPEDYVISGGFSQSITPSDAITSADQRFTFSYQVVLQSATGFKPFIGSAECFDNPPLQP